MSAQGYLVGAATRHQILIQRLAAGHAREVLPALKRMQKELQSALLRSDLTSFETARLSVLIAEIGVITAASAKEMAAVTIANMQEFAAYEAQFTQRMLQGAVTIQLAGVNTAALAETLLTKKMTLISGKKTTITTMAGMFDTFAAGAAREIETAVIAGIMQGQTTEQIARQVFSLTGTRTKAQARTAVITAANQTGSLAREQLYQANRDVLAGEEWVAVLDSSTRLEHAVLDGTHHKIGDGPQTPLGYNCRCIRIPIVDPAFAVLRTGATRASMTGPVSSQKTFAGFFADQGADFQREFLGPERYELYKSGNVSFKGFADTSGRVYSLDELKAREGLALN